MSTADLTFPPIDTPVVKTYPTPAATGFAGLSTAGPQRLAIVTVEEFAVGKLRHSEPVLRALAAKYAGQTFDVSTAKGMEATKAARLDLRENGRFAVQRVRDETKKALNDGKTAIEKEADRLIALVQPEEDRVHALIQARETALAAEKAERDRIEAEREAAHRAKLDRLATQAELARGQPSVRIAEVIRALQFMHIGPEWEEFQWQAEAVRERSLDALLAEHLVAIAREQEALRIEAQRIEQARIAVEQAEQQRQLDEQTAELRRKLAAIESTVNAAAALAEQQRFEAESAAQHVAEATIAAAAVGSLGAGIYMGPGQANDKMDASVMYFDITPPPGTQAGMVYVNQVPQPENEEAEPAAAGLADEVIADKRVRDAAPQLLAALQALVTVTRAMDADLFGEWETLTAEQYHAALAQAEEAIALARGETT